MLASLPFHKPICRRPKAGRAFSFHVQEKATAGCAAAKKLLAEKAERIG